MARPVGFSGTRPPRRERISLLAKRSVGSFRFRDDVKRVEFVKSQPEESLCLLLISLNQRDFAILVEGRRPARILPSDQACLILRETSRSIMDALSLLGTGA